MLCHHVGGFGSRCSLGVLVTDLGRYLAFWGSHPALYIAPVPYQSDLIDHLLPHYLGYPVCHCQWAHSGMKFRSHAFDVGIVYVRHN